VSTKQVQFLQTIKCFRDRNATAMSRKCSYDSGRKFSSEWEMTFVRAGSGLADAGTWARGSMQDLGAGPL